jgi:hypothetical protein
MAQFKKGDKKKGGRQKGTKNKATLQIKELLKNKYPDYDPVLAMAAIATDEKVDLGLRLAANKEVAKYMWQQLKAIEVTGNAGGAIQVETVYRLDNGTEITF